MHDSHSRTRVAELLSDKIIRQQLPAGRSVGEVSLANELGVSRTPIREALLGLENDGLVRSRRGRGFIVQPLSAEEARQSYPIIAGLERLAVESSPPVSVELADRLHVLNARMAAAESPYERMKLDAAWHALIVSGCGNPRLERLIDSVKQTTLRYEYAYLKVAALRDRSIGEHERIVALLQREPGQAAKAIEHHWRQGMEEVLVMLDEGGE